MIFGPWQNAGKTQTCCCVHGSVWAEWEGVWNWKLPWAFCPHHGLCAGVSFTKWCFYGQGLLQMLPGSLKKNETVSAASLTLKYCSVCVNYFLHKRCFKLQSYACSLKKCLCIWGWLHVVHKKFFQICIETYCVFQLRQGAPIAWGATHELIGVKAEPYACRFQIDAWSWSGLWGV